MNKCLHCNKEVKNKYCNVSCQNYHQNKGKSDAKYGLFKEFKVICASCDQETSTLEREKLFPKRERYFCNISCANRYSTKFDDKKETKEIECQKCKSVVSVNKRSSEKLCISCKPKQKRISQSLKSIHNL